MELFQIRSIDPNIEVPELELLLAKPNRQIIGDLSEAMSRSGTFQFGRYNEITFTIPKYITVRHKQVINPNYENIRGRYLVKAEYANISEWMIVTKISKTGGINPKKEVTVKSLQYQLNDKKLRNYEVESYTPKQAMTDALRYSTWGIDHIDPELENLHRAFSETNVSALQMLFKIAETYNGILQFDTFTKRVSLRKQENVEMDLGLSVYYGKYIKSLQHEDDSEAIVTRLHVYGKDDLSINEVNPAGTSYIEDFSFFLQGYETDENGNVISSSPYMSDELCQAILDYNELVNSKEGLFKTYLSDLDPIREEWIQRQSELYVLQMEMAIIEDNLDIAKAVGESTTDLIAQRNAKQTEINAKQTQIDDLDYQMVNIELDIEELQDEIAIENNFSEDLIRERNEFIVEDEWTDRNYFDAEELYEEGKRVLKQSSEPKQELDFSLVQFLEIVEAQSDWDKIGLGYVIRVYYDPLDIEVKALITEMRIGFDDRNLSLTVSNVDYKSEKKKLAEMLYNTAISTSQRVDMSSIKWNESSNETTKISEILQGEWDAATRRIVAGVNESVTMDGRGLRIVNPDFSNEMLIGTAGVLALSRDGGANWQTAITPRGIYADVLMGKMILGENLYIENDAGILRFDSDGLTVTRQDDLLKTFLNATDGIKIQRRRNSASPFEDVFYADADGILYARGLIIDETSTLGGYTIEEIMEEAGGEVTDDRIENVIPSKVTGVVATGLFKTIMLEWNYTSSISIARYEVHASQQNNFLPSQDTLVFAGKTGMYSHQGEQGQTWYFRVRAVNTHGVAGSYSDQVSASTEPIMSDDILFGEIIADHLANNLDIADKLAQNTIDRINEAPMQQIGFTQEEIEAAEERLNTELNNRIGDVNDSIADLIGRADGIDGTITSINQNIDDINGKISTTVDQITNIDGVVTGHTTTLEQHATAIGAKAEKTEVYTRTDVDGLLGNKVDTTVYNNQVTAFNLKFDGIETFVQNTEVTLDGLTGDMTSALSQISTIEQTAGRIEQNVSEIRVDVGRSTQMPMFDRTSGNDITINHNMGTYSKYTILVRFYPNVVNATIGFLNMPAESQHHLEINNRGRLRSRINDINVISPNDTITPKKWHDVAIVVNSTDGIVKQIVNGRLVYQETGSFRPTNFSDIKIGNSTSSGREWDGLIDFVTIYSYDMSESEVVESFGIDPTPSQGAIAHYRLKGNLNDSVGGNHGTAGNNLKWTSIGTIASLAEASITTLAGQVELKASQTEVNSLANRMTSAESAITLIPDEIDLRVTNGISALEIGGRNLLTNSNFINGTTNWGSYSSGTLTRTIENNSRFGRVMRVVTNASGWVSHTNLWNIANFNTGDEITVSFWMYAENTGRTVSVQFRTSGSGIVNVTNSVARSFQTGWNKYEFTLKAINDSDVVNNWWMLINLSGSCTVLFANVQAEYGNKATDWSLAEEDRVDKTNVLSSINLSSEGVRIQGNKIHLTGQTLIDDAIIGNAAIANGAITNAKIGNLAVSVGKIQDGAITNAKIANLAVDDAKIANLNASKINAGVLNAARVRIGSGTTFDSNYDPTTKETPTGAQNKANAARDAAITYVDDNAISLVKNPAVTGSHTGWSASGLSSVLRTFEGVSTRVLQSSRSTDTQNYSDWFKVDPSKAYEVSLWISKSASGTYYFGLNGLNSSGSTIGFIHVSPSGTVSNTNNTNFYFSSGTATTSWTKLVGYIMPSGTNPADMAGIGTGSSVIMRPDTDRIRVRFLNWNNNGTTRQLWVANPKVVEVDPNAIIRGTQANNLTSTWRWGNTTEIDGGHIRTKTITTDHISANTLSAISANLGDVTAGNITGVNITGANITSYNNSTNDVVTLENGQVTTYERGSKRFGMYGNGLVAYHWETEAEVASFRASHIDNQRYGAGIVGYGDYFGIGRHIGGGTSRQQLGFDWDGSHDSAHLYGGAGIRDSGYLELRSTYSGGTAGARVPKIITENRTVSGTAYSRVRVFVGRDNRVPTTNNFTSGFEVFQYTGNGSGATRRLLNIDTESDHNSFAQFDAKIYAEQYVYTNAIDHLPYGSGVNLYLRPAASGEVRITQTGSTTDYRDLRCNWLYVQDGVVQGGRNGDAQLVLEQDSTGPRVWSASINNRTYSGAANMFITEHATLGRTTSARKYKLLEKPVDTHVDPYNILNLVPKSWYDKQATEAYANYLNNPSNVDLSKEDIPMIERIPGLIAEDVADAGLDMFVNYVDGEIESLMYDRLWTLLIPVVKNLKENTEDEINWLKMENQLLRQRVSKLENKLIQ